MNDIMSQAHTENAKRVRLPGRKPVLVSSFVLLFSLTLSLHLFAAPPGSPYAAGETLDPSCAPGDANCSVASPEIGTDIQAYSAILDALADSNLRIDANTLSSASGALILEPLAGQSLNVNLSATGDFAVNTDDLYVDTSTGRVGVGTSAPERSLHVVGNGIISERANGTPQLVLRTTGGAAGTKDWRFNVNSTSGYFGIADTDNNTRFTIESGSGGLLYFRADGNFGINTSTPAARLHVASTTEQLRLGYDTSNYYSTTVDADGTVTFDATGTGAGFVFSDDVTLAGDIDITGSIIPSADITYDLGSPTRQWRDVYIGPGSLYINGQKVLEESGSDIIVSADEDQNLSIQTSGTGNVELNPTGSGQVLLKGNVSISAGMFFETTDGSAVDFADGIRGGNISLADNLITAANTNGSIEIAPNGIGVTYISSGNFGVGTSGPAAKIHALATTEQLRLAYNSTSYWSDTIASDGGRTIAGFGTDADLNIAFGGATDGDFSVNTDDLFVDTSSGYVGVGTGSPDTLLEVLSADPVLTIRDTETNAELANATLRLAESGGSDTLGSYWDIKMTTSRFLGFEFSGTRYLTITDAPDGFMGVGTDTPSAKIHSLSTSEQLRLGYNTTQYWSDTIASDGGRTIAGFGTDADLNIAFGGATDGDFSVNTDDLFVDTSTGFVGVGTTGPEGSIHVTRGGATAPTATSSTSQIVLSASNNRIEFGTPEVSNARYAWILARHNTAASLGGYYSTLHLQPRVTGTIDDYEGVAIGFAPTVKLDSTVGLAVNDNVGIGTTSPSARLHAISTTEQLRLGYDTTNYWSDTVASDGGRTIAGFGTDADLNISFSGATDGDFSVNTDDLFVDTSTGKVGIGTTDLDVNSALTIGGGAGGRLTLRSDVVHLQFDALVGDQYLSGNSSTSFNIRNRYSGGTLSFGTNNSGSEATRMIITSVGRVGIGDISPDGLLDVEYTGAVTATNYGINLSNLTTNTTTDAIDKYGLYITSTGSFTGSAGTATNNYGLYVAAPSGADNNYAAVFAGGNVGIGTTAPGKRLEVNTSTSGDGLILRNPAGVNGTYIGHYFSNANASGTNNLKAGLLFERTGGGGIGKLHIATRSDTGSNSVDLTDARLTVDGNTGYVGIGTTSPSSFLHILGTATQLRLGYDATEYWSATVGSNGDITFAGTGVESSFTIQSTGSGGLFIKDPTGGILRLRTAGGSDEIIQIGAQNSSSTSMWVGLGGIDPSIGTNTVYRSTGTIEFLGLSSAEYARFNSSGNLGIGTGSTVSARLHSLSTTEQLRLGYDASNYLSATVGSTGSATFDLTGTSPTFTFSDPVISSVGFSVGGTPSSADPISYLGNRNSDTRIQFRNENTGTSASMNLYIGNSSSGNSALALRVFGTGFSTSGLNIQDGAKIATRSELSGGLVVGTETTAPLIFGINDTEVARFDGTTGNLGIGTSTNLADAKLTINGDIGTVSEGDIFSQYDDDSDTWYPVFARYWDAHDTFASSTFIFGNGTNAVVGVEKPGSQDVTLFQVRAVDSTFSGNISYVGDLSDVSDARRKEDVETILDPFSVLGLLRPVSFRMIGETDRDYGFIAQEVQEAFPDAVRVIDAENGYLGVNYLDFIPYLVGGVQELDLEIGGIREFSDETFIGKVREWLASASNGILKIFAKEVETERLHVTEICIDDETCLSQDELRELFEDYRSSSNAAPSGDAQADDEAADPVSPDDAEDGGIPLDSLDPDDSITADVPEGEPSEDAVAPPPAPSSQGGEEPAPEAGEPADPEPAEDPAPETASTEPPASDPVAAE